MAIIARYEELLNGGQFWTVNQTVGGFYGKVIGHYFSWKVSDGKSDIKKDFPDVILRGRK